MTKRQMAELYERYISQRKKNMALRATNKHKVNEIFKGVYRRIECEANNEIYEAANLEYAKDEVKFKFR